MEYKICPVDAKKIIEVAELWGKYNKRGKELTVSSIAKALGVSEVTARNAIGAIEQLKLSPALNKLANLNLEEQKQLFRKHLQSYEPFLEFVYFTSKGDDPFTAIRKVIEIYGIKRKSKDVLWAFQNWGVFSGIFKNKNFELSESIKILKPSKVAELELLDDELKAKIWIKKVLEDADSYLTDDDYDSLVKAILNTKKDPRNSVKLSGEVLEDILRKIAKDKNVDVRRKNGISEIAEELRKNRIIASKHVGILKGIQVFLDRDIFDNLSSFRNMAHHSIDKYEMKKWELSEELAISYIIQVMLCIKSLYYYVTKNQLKF